MARNGVSSADIEEGLNFLNLCGNNANCHIFGQFRIERPFQTAAPYQLYYGSVLLAEGTKKYIFDVMTAITALICLADYKVIRDKDKEEK